MDQTGERVLDFQAYCHSAGLSSQVMLKDPSDAAVRKKLLDLLYELKKDPIYGIREIYTREQVEREFQLSGPFEYVIDGAGGIAFGHACVGREVKRPGDSDYTYVLTSHGHRPELGPQPVFFAAGPDFANGVRLKERSILDEVPTYTELLGLKMHNLKGTAMTQLLSGR